MAEPYSEPRSGGGYELETCHSFLLSLSFDGRCFRLGQAIPCHYHLRRPSKRDPFCQRRDRKSTRLNSSHGYISYAVFCLKKKKNKHSLYRGRHSCKTILTRSVFTLHQTL